MPPQEIASAGWTDVIGVLLRLADVDRELREHALAAATREELLALRHRLLVALPAERSIYEALVRAGRLPAIVALNGEHCTGCHLRLPPQRARAVAGQLPVARCPHCARLLYDPDAIERRP